jgi:hypothetical protein
MHQYTYQAPLELTRRSPEASIHLTQGLERSSNRSSVDLYLANDPTPASVSYTDSMASCTKMQVPLMTRARSLPLGGRLKWKKTWRIPVTIVGFYLLGKHQWSSGPNLRHSNPVTQVNRAALLSRALLLFRISRCPHHFQRPLFPRRQPRFLRSMLQQYRSCWSARSGLP